MSWRKRVAGLVAAVLVLVALGWARAVWMPALGWLLRRDEAPGGTIALLLMGDGTRGRAVKALELYRNGQSGKIAMIPERYDPDLIQKVFQPLVEAHREFLLASGVRADDLILVGGCQTTSTADEARCFRRFLLEQAPVPSAVTLVTSWYHTSRAGWIFERVLEGSGIELRVVAAPYFGLDWRDWWGLEASFIATFEEYLKWIYWRLKGIPTEGRRR